MFRTKKDVERHVSDILSKISSENEKNLRGYTFARLYFQVKDYENAKKYLSGFLSIRDHHAPAHKLMAQIFEATNNAENALQSYKRSLEIDSHQTDIVLKICELYCQLSVDHETARYWADRAEQLFPHNDIVFKLRECIVSAEGEPNHQELETLIATELEAQPRNISLRVRLLRLYLDTERVKEAYDHATMIESKRLFPQSVEWYYLLGDIFEAFQEEFGTNLDASFYMNYMSALDRLILLTLGEPHAFSCENGRKQYSLNDAAAVLLTFDQLLKKACDKKINESSWTYFIHHMKGQLYFYMATLLLKRAKMDQGNRKEALRFSAGLAVVCYTFKPVNLLQEIWFSHLEDNQKAFTNYFQQGCLRTSFIGHVIINICKEDRSKWLQKLKLDICINQVKERIYSRTFSSIALKDKLLTSYFIKDSTFENCSLEFPSEAALQEYDKAAYKLRPDSLHHLVWLELHRLSGNGIKFHDSLSEVFKGLQYSNKNLSTGSCESLCILDLEAYLCATVYQAQCAIEKKKNFPSPKFQDSQLSYTPDIADPMCSNQQASWWKAAYGLHACTIKDKLGESRRELAHGLEVIRCVGNHNMEVQLTVHLARMFADKADHLLQVQGGSGDKNKNLVLDNISALQQRAMHYWNISLNLLDKASSGLIARVSKEQMFVGLNKSLSKDEINILRDDGQLYIAVNLMNSEKLDEAAEILSKLTTPYGSYYLALTLKRMAALEESFSNTKSVLLTKAKNSIHETMDRIKDDKKHPLNKEIHIILGDIEMELGTYRNLNNSQNNEDSDEVDAYYSSPDVNNSIYITPNSHKSAKHSTPRPSAQFTSTKSKINFSEHNPHKHFEPSPERLDAQIRALSLNQDTIVKSLLDQQKSFMESTVTFTDTLKQNTEVLEQLKKLLEELKVSELRCQARGSRKHSYAKGQGDEEDYNDYDPNNLLEFYAEEGNEDYRNPAYSYNPSNRIVHEAPSLNYVMPAIPPGPPPPLNHYNYQYPPHAVLPPPPPPPVEQRPSYYHPAPGQGLPFSEGQQLPQFQFHVATPVVKHPPPVMTNVGNIPQAVQLPPPAGVSLQPTQPVIPPPANMPMVQPTSSPMPMASPWTKTPVPHAFQISLPSSAPFAPGITQSTSQSELKNLLKMPPPAIGKPFGQTLPPLPPTQTSVAPVTTSASMSIFAGISKTPEMNKLERSRCDSENTGSPDIDGDLEREVMGDFKPLIPLPAEIVVETGEENEVVLFEDRAKLYRFVDQEWKERGIGIVKILHHNASGRVRLLMRRDQVLKVCANHYMSANMEISPLKSSDRAWTWVAQDFADEVLKPEHFCIRFKTAELAASFKNAFDKAINIVKESEVKNTTSPKAQVASIPFPSKGFGNQFMPKAGTWSCPTCYVNNQAGELICVACETKKPSPFGMSSITSPLSAKANVIPIQTVQSPNMPIKITSNENQSGINTAVSFPSSKFSTNSAIVSSTSATQNVFGGFTFSSSPMIREAEEPDVKDREILVVSTKSKNGPQVSKVNQANSSPFSGFSFGKSPTSTGLTVQISNNSRNVIATNEKSSPFEGISNKSTASTPIFSTNSLTSMLNSSNSNENSLSKIQSLVQNVNPTFGLESKDTLFKTSNVSFGNESQKLSNDTFFGTAAPLGPSASTSKLSTDGSPEEFIPTAEFKPVVPLPALVDIKTGEEEEEKLFEERAKLFRYDLGSKEWKERGTGELKILYLKQSHKYRILMRRDQVLKICANHYILPEMKLTRLANSDKAWVWFAQDFSGEDLLQEQFAARFKTVDIAKNFQSVFLKCQEQLKGAVPNETANSNSSADNRCVGNKSALEKLLDAPTGAWICPHCQKSNVNNSSCVNCKTLKHTKEPVSEHQKSEQKPLSELFKPNVGTWECQSCYVRNEPGVSKCVSCDSPNAGSKPLQTGAIVPPNTANSFSSEVKQTKTFGDAFKPQPGSWECKACYVRNTADNTKCVSCDTDKSGSSSSSNIFSGNKSSPANPSNAFGTFQFGSSNSSAKSVFSFGTPKTGGDFVFGMRPATQSTTFSFGHTTVSNKDNEASGLKPSLPSNNAASIFGGTTQKIFGENKASPQTSLFNDSTTKTPSFGDLAESQKSESEGFKFGSPQKYEFHFPGIRPRSPSKTPKSPRSPATPSDVDEEDEEDSDADNIYFQPAIPLPPKVEVKTGEEDERIVFCNRAKLYRFSSGEWKERGIGDIKILIDDKTNRVRLLMRREQVLKVCLNHHLTKDIKFERRNDKSWSWAATDFSETEPSPELLAIKFKTNELADEFKNTIDVTLKQINDLASPLASEKVVLKPATPFSFKSDAPTKVEPVFGLPSQFGASVQEKSTFGNTASGFSFKEAKTEDSNKVESGFSFGSLQAQFGTSSQGKSVFGNTASRFSFKDSKENSDTPSSFSFSLNENSSNSFVTKSSIFGNLGVKPLEMQPDPDIEVVYENTATADQVAAALKLHLPKNFFLYEKKEPCPGCRGCTDTIPPYRVVIPETDTQEPSSSALTVPEVSTPSSQETNTPFSSSKFDSFSFSQIANKSDFQGIPKSSSSTTNVFAGAGTPLFQNLNTSANDSNEEVIQGPDIYYEPIIPLPDLIEVKTGEEDETALFVFRAKLFRYDPNGKQWKERGIGDIKILSHNENVRFRIIMRRDQVHNVACNHCISEDMSLTPLATSENALCWTALDYSDGKGEATQFAVRFKSKEQTNQFKEIFLQCQEKLRSSEKNKSSTASSNQTNSENTTLETCENASGNVLQPVEKFTPEKIAEESTSDKGSDDDDDDDDEEEDVLFEKQTSLEIFDDSENKFKTVGMGCLKITYDDTSFGYRVCMESHQGEILCEHLIAVQTCLRTDGKSAIWAAIDLAVDPITRRQFRVTFSSVEALNEFRKCFEEGKEIAIKSPIVEKSD